MNANGHNPQGPVFEPEERTRAKKGGGKKSSEAATVRSFVAAAYKGRLAKPGYVKACHSKAPEALVKVVPNPPHGSQVLKLLEYVARTDADLEPKKSGEEVEPVDHRPALILEDHEGYEHKDAAAISELYKTWAKDFDPIKRDGKQPRHVMHLVLSAKGDNTPANQRRVMEAARATIKRQFPGYRYAIGLHQDGKRPHVHLVIACKGIEQELERQDKTPKLRVGPAEIMQMRTAFARELTQQGLKHVATLRKDRPHVLERVNQGLEKLKPERRFWFTGAHKEMTQGFKDVEMHHLAFQKALDEHSGLERIQEAKEQIRTKITALQALARKHLKEGSKNRQAAFGFLRKIERDLKKIETVTVERPQAKTQERQNPKKLRLSLAEQKTRIQAEIDERQAKGLVVDHEKTALERVNSRIEAAERDKSAKGVMPSDLNRIQATLDAARKALKASDMTPEARTQAEQVLLFHEAAMKTALAPQERPRTPEVAPLAPASLTRAVAPTTPRKAPTSTVTQTVQPSKGMRR